MQVIAVHSVEYFHRHKSAPRLWQYGDRKEYFLLRARAGSSPLGALQRRCFSSLADAGLTVIQSSQITRTFRNFGLYRSHTEKGAPRDRARHARAFCSWHKSQLSVSDVIDQNRDKRPGRPDKHRNGSGKRGLWRARQIVLDRFMGKRSVASEKVQCAKRTRQFGTQI